MQKIPNKSDSAPLDLSDSHDMRLNLKASQIHSVWKAPEAFEETSGIESGFASGLRRRPLEKLQELIAVQNFTSGSELGRVESDEKHGTSLFNNWSPHM